jgi:hypothetical protein
MYEHSTLVTRKKSLLGPIMTFINEFLLRGYSRTSFPELNENFSNDQHNVISAFPT